MKKNFRPHHFSLIELLLVIAVLLVLISLIQPTFKRLIRTANLMSCAANFRSLGLTFENFAGDHDQEYLDTDQLMEKKKNGSFSLTTPVMRFSYRGYPKALVPYHHNLRDSLYCPEDESEDALEKSTRSSASVSYEFKSILVSQSRDWYNRSVRISDFEIPNRQSLLISRKTYHADEAKGHHRQNNMFYFHNLYFVDGHVALDYVGYNHPIVSPGKSVSWMNYPVLENNERASGTYEYLERRCELDENSIILSR